MVRNIILAILAIIVLLIILSFLGVFAVGDAVVDSVDDDTVIEGDAVVAPAD